jgi:hypothetical protein
MGEMWGTTEIDLVRDLAKPAWIDRRGGLDRSAKIPEDEVVDTYYDVRCGGGKML